MKLNYIDSVRGIAILLVMMIHTSQHLNLEGINSYIISFIEVGPKGVQMFFLASAFTLFLSYSNRIEFERKVVLNFYLRRFFRIAPMYYIGIIYFTWQHFLASNNMDSLGEIISNLFFVHGISPYWINSSVPGGWSITVEMTFYLFIPFLFQKITTLNRAATFTVGSYIFAMGSRLLLKKIQLISDTQLWDAFLYYNFFNQLPIFGIGIILYFIVIKKDFKISTLNVLIITAIFIAHNIWNVFLPRYVLFSIGFILLIFTLSKKEYKLFVNQFTRFWGKISYSSYLVHFAILFWLDYSKIDSYINLIPIESAVVRFVIWYFIVLAFTSVISLFFYNTVELSFQRIGKKIIKALGEKNTTGDSHGANQLAEHKSENRMSMEGEVNSIEPVGEGANLLRR